MTDICDIISVLKLSLEYLYHSFYCMCFFVLSTICGIIMLCLISTSSVWLKLNLDKWIRTLGYVYFQGCTHIHIHIHIHIYIYVCVYVYTYTYIHIHICIYIYIEREI